MARSIVAAIGQIKSELADTLSPRLIRGVCQAIGYVWRERRLDPVTTVHLFLLQVLHGNAACSQVPRLGGAAVSGEAYCQARKRLPVPLLRTLVWLFGRSLHREALDDGRWHGHRTFHVDGTGVSMSDTPALQKAFGQPGTQKPGCGFPVMRLVALFHAGTGLLLNMVGAPLRSHDLSEVGPLHGELQPGDVLIGDRAFCSFAHLATLAAQGVFGLFRGHSSQIVDFRPHRRHRGKRSRKKPHPRGLPSSVWLKRLGRHDLARDELEDGDGSTDESCTVSIGGERREDAVGELPQPGARGLLVDDLSPEGLAAEEDVGVRARVVEPGRIVGAASL